ncbi:hypothetical protein Tco_0555165, partial [Tanacetum coccineum]
MRIIGLLFEMISTVFLLYSYEYVFKHIFGHTDLSINSESTEVDAPPVNDDNANANKGNAEDDDVAHVLDDDDVVVSDDDEVNPST